MCNVKAKKKTIVFSPHPDDETFGCGGTIAKKVAEGHEVYIAIMTDGRYAFLNVLGIGQNPTPEQLKKIRIEEVKRATKILGIPEGNLIFLNFVDGTLQDNMEEVKQIVIDILRGKCPDEIYFPYRRDGHPDHRAAYKIIKNANRELGIPAICYQYTITHRFARFGCFIDAFLNFIFRTKKVCVDVSDFLSVKKLAINEFKSEITAMSRIQKRSVVGNTKKFLKNKEVFFVEK